MNINKISTNIPQTDFKARCIVLDKTKQIPQNVIKECKDAVSKFGTSTDDTIIEFENHKVAGRIATYIKTFVINSKNYLEKTHQHYCGEKNIVSLENIRYHLNKQLFPILYVPKNIVDRSTFEKADKFFLHDGFPFPLMKVERDIYNFVKNEFFLGGASRHYTYGYDKIGCYRYISEERFPGGAKKTYEFDESNAERLSFKPTYKYTDIDYIFPDQYEFTKKELSTVLSTIAENNNVYEAKQMLQTMVMLKNTNLLNKETLSIPFDNYESLLMTIPDIQPTSTNKKEYAAIMDILKSVKDIDFNQIGNLDITFFEKVLMSENMQLLDVIKQSKNRIHYFPVYEEIYKNIQNPEFKKAVEEMEFDFTIIENFAKKGNTEALNKIEELSNSKFMHYPNKVLLAQK